MADSAPQVQYRNELVAAFEEEMSWLRRTTTQEAVIKGNSAVFAVAGSGGAAATTRGLSGLIPARADDMTQLTATLTEWHDLVHKTSFNIFISQGDQRTLMQRTTAGVLNRRIDQDIINALDTATVSLGSATTVSLAIIGKAVTTLGEAKVPVEQEDKMWAVATPAVRGYLMQTTEFNSADYVDVKYLNGPAVRTKRFAGFNWIFHPLLTGVGTSSEKCYFFHSNAIGSVYDNGSGLQTAIGYNDEQDYSYARASTYAGAKVLQNTGIVQFLHDASAI